MEADIEMDETKVTVRADLHPTEAREKVVGAIRNLFPDAEFETDDDGSVVAQSRSVERLRELIDRQEINETAHEHLSDSILGDTIAFRLSKQPATVGRVNFDVGGHELGALRVRVEADDPEEFVDRVTRPL